jgi:hypothetical protein
MAILIFSPVKNFNFACSVKSVWNFDGHPKGRVSENRMLRRILDTRERK